MIKINLIKSKVGASDPANVNIDFSTSSGGNSGLVPALVKVLIMVSFLLGAMYYRDVQITELNIKAAAANQEMSALRAQIEVKKQEAGAKPGLEAEAKALDDKLNILRNLSRLRLIEVKSLDFIQSIIPERVWLKAVEYTPPQFRVSGFSTAEEDVAKFLKALEAGPYFTEVILLQSKETKSNQGTLKSFEISFRAESKN